MNLLGKIKKLNFRSIFLNFRLLPFSQARYFPLLVNDNVKIVDIGGGVIIRSEKLFPGMIQLGYSNVGTIDSNNSPSILQVSKKGRLVFLGKAHIGSGFNISVGTKGHLIFGDNFTCSGKSSFISHKKIIFGRDCLISWDCTFMDTDFHSVFQNSVIINENLDIEIGNHVWIGCNCTVLKGSILPDDSVLGAGSVLKKKLVHKNCIYAGNPVQIIKRNIFWDK